MTGSTEHLLQSRWVNWLVIAGACLAFGLVAPTSPRHVMLDQHVYIRTVEEMNGGTGYYTAMDDALREVYGPSSTVRAFRLPTIFTLWSLPSLSDRGIWILFLVVAGVSGVLFSSLSTIPLFGLWVTLYMLLIGMLPGSGWTSQFATTELWVIPLVALSVIAWQRRRYGYSVVAAAAAFSIRELAAVLILGGFVAAWRRRAAVWPWLVATLVAGVAYMAHMLAVQPYLVAEGRETSLLGTGSIASIGRMAGFGLPGGTVTGFVLLAVATLYLRHNENRTFLAALWLLPMTGLLVDRPYWGIITVPFLVMWTTEYLGGLIHQAINHG